MKKKKIEQEHQIDLLFIVIMEISVLLNQMEKATVY